MLMVTGVLSCRQYYSVCTHLKVTNKELCALYLFLSVMFYNSNAMVAGGL